MPTQGKYDFDYVPINPARERAEPIPGDGIAVGTIRETVPEAKSERKPCPHCGHEDWRTGWQIENQFKCYECGKMSNEAPVDRV